MKRKKYIGVLILTVVLIFSFSGCAAAKSANQKVTTAEVAVANDFNPYSYLDKDNQYIGYEIDVLKDVDNLLPQYQFHYQTVSDQFVALTSKKVDLISHQWEKNSQRASTYLFADELTTTWANYIIVKGGRTDIKSLADLKGKTVLVFQGGNDAYLIETYNKKHNNAIKVVYYSSSDFSIIVNKLNSGAIDAFLTPPQMLKQLNTAYKTNMQAVGKPVSNSNTYFIYRKNDADETKLQEAVDGALKTLRKNGTLKKLSIKWLGEDATEPQKLDTES